VELRRRGGQFRAANLSTKKRREIARQAAFNRWGKGLSDEEAIARLDAEVYFYKEDAVNPENLAQKDVEDHSYTS
jgi:hypothetical protein